MKTVLFCVAAALALLACSKEESRAGPPTVSVIHARVSDLRMTFGTQEHRVSGNGDMVGGAIIGGLLYGPTGAVIGAAAGAPTSVSQNGGGALVACSFVAVAPDGRKFTFKPVASGNQNARVDRALRKCSTLRDGDTVAVRVASPWDAGWVASDSYIQKPEP